MNKTRVIRIDTTKRNVDKIIIESGQINFHESNSYDNPGNEVNTNNIYTFLEDFEPHVYNTTTDPWIHDANKDIDILIKHKDSGLIYPHDIDILPIDTTLDEVHNLNEDDIWVPTDFSTGITSYVRSNLCCKRSIKLIAKRYPKLPLVDFIKRNDIRMVLKDHGLKWEDKFYDPSERFAYNTPYVSEDYKYDDLLRIYREHTIKNLVGHEKMAYDDMIKRKQDEEAIRERIIINERKIQIDKKSRKYNEAIERIKMAKMIFKDNYKNMLSVYEKQIDNMSYDV